MSSDSSKDHIPAKSNHENSEMSEKHAKKNKKKRIYGEVQRTPEEIEETNIERVRRKRKKHDEKVKTKFELIRTVRSTDPVQYKSVESQLEYFWNCFQKVESYSNLTSLEIEQVKPSVESFTKPQFELESWTIDNIQEFINALNPPKEFASLPSESEPHGSPYILIITRSAVRAVLLVKYLLPFRQYAHIGTLFAKHKQVENQVSFLEGWHCKLAVGTPNRILALAENGALKLDLLSHFIIDMDRDMKSLSVVDLKDCQSDFFDFYAKHIHQRVTSGQTKIVMF